MKNIYTLIIAVLASGLVSAQSDITFEVDMTDATVDPMGVHIAGNFYDYDGDDVADNPDIGENWNPGLLELTDMDGDMVYSTTLSLVDATYEFKFINGNVWDNAETVPQTCRVEVVGNENRYFGTSADNNLYHICWESCAACGDYAIRFRVDMSQEDAVSPNGVHVSGEFQGWEAANSPLFDADGDGVWEHFYTFDESVLDDDVLTFKYINGNDWTDPNEFVPEDCGDTNGNREMAIAETNTVLDTYCYNTCSSCTEPTMVTLQVDMSTQAEVSANGVHVAGSFQGWNAAGTPLTDMGSGIWEVTVPIAPGDYQYKFINGDDWSGNGDGNIDNENLTGECSESTNRVITVGEEPMTVTWCYNQCSETCVEDPDPANITFRVDMTELVDAGTLSADGVWFMGDVTEPNWQAGAVQMEDLDADNVYEATVLVSGAADIQFKFTNGDPYPGDVVDPSVEETGDFEAAGCGTGNGLGGFNRTHTRSGSDEVLDAFCWNSCEVCVVSVEEVSGLKLDAFPNPAHSEINLNAPFGAQVIVIDATGREVINFQMNQSIEQINVQDWKTGIYFIQVTDGVGFGKVRVVVE